MKTGNTLQHFDGRLATKTEQVLLRVESCWQQDLISFCRRFCQQTLLTEHVLNANIDVYGSVGGFIILQIFLKMNSLSTSIHLCYLGTFMKLCTDHYSYVFMISIFITVYFFAHSFLHASIWLAVRSQAIIYACYVQHAS